jgi:protein-L-isoaspartate O-methyltransferase
MKAKRSYILLLLMVISGALLTFSLEPLTGRMMTPYFGGAIHVWTVTMMVFQGLLFAAYLYAHLFAKRLGGLHLLLLLAPLAFLPLKISASPQPDAPILALIVDLLVSVGVPFFALSTTSVVAQQWLADAESDQAPWSLYAASNIGSLIALLSYPLWVEPNMGLRAQGTLWAILYGLHAAVAVAAWRSLTPKTAPSSETETPPLAWLTQIQWVALAAGPSMLLLATTNVITSELGSFPLFWVLPLALYLASYTVAFRDHEEAGYLAEFWPDLLLALALFCQFVVLAEMQPFLYAIFFGLCWVVHERLYLSRPPVQHLTAFYLAIALGGWLGGLAVSVVAPLIFDRLAEVGLSLAWIGLSMLWMVGRPSLTWWKKVHIRFSGSRAILGVTVAILLALLWANDSQRGILDRQRTLYGVFTLAERTAENGHRYRELASGQTAHGKQYVDGPNRAIPMSYYHPAGPNHRALTLRPSASRIAGIGLGAGALASMISADEEVVFYEINPASERMARQWFSYLHDCQGQVEVRIGDARLLFQTETDRRPYDAIFVDAFSGDGIPTHLLTAEALETYIDRLSAEGVLVFHISNRYYDLRGVLGTAATSLDLAAFSRRADGSESNDPLYDAATTVAMSRSPAMLRTLVDLGWENLTEASSPPALWTDDYIDILSVLHGPRPARANPGATP